MKRISMLFLIGLLLGVTPVLAQGLQATIIEYGETLRGTITDSRPAVYYSFSGSEGDVVTITMIADDESQLDTYLYLYTANDGGREIGELVEFNDDAADLSVGNFNSQLLDVVLPDDGLYLIEATRFQGQGNYTLTLEVAGGSSASSAGDGLSYGQSVRGYVDGDDREVQYTFMGTAGDLVTITMIADDIDQLDTYLYLYAADGVTELIRNDDATDSSLGRYNSQIVDFELPTTGQYVIGASRFSGGGDFTLTLESDSVGVTDVALTEVRQWAASASGSSQFGTDGWSFGQATGEPNTATCGDIRTAWASSSRVGQDFLILDYAQSVIPTQINIYQTYNPGAIISVEVESITTSQNVSLPNSADPVGNTPCPGVFTLDVTEIDFPVDRVIIYVDQTLTNGWNEIDAVELVGLGEGGAPMAGELLFDVPAGWYIAEETALEYVLASSEALYESLSSDTFTSLQPGEQIILIYPYEAFAFDLVDVLNEVKDLLAGPTTSYGDILNARLGENLYARTTVEEDGLEGYLYVLYLEDTLFVLQSLAGDLTAGQAIMDSLVASMSFASAPASGDTPSGGTPGGNTLSLAGVTVDVPDGWVSSINFENAYLASDAATLSVIEDGGFGTIADGQMGITLLALSNDSLPELGITVTTVEGALAAFNELIGSTGEVLTYDAAPFRAAISFVQGGFAPPGGVLIATVYPEGFMLWGVQVGDGDDYIDFEDRVFEVIGSARFE